MFARYILPVTILLTSVFALPLAERDVVSPPITSPNAGTTWHVGQTQTVTWNTTGLPTQQSNPVGSLVLGYWYNNSENLMLNSPLATNLNYSVGQAQITVPNVPTRSDYIVVLFGDSGNASPEFTIINDPSSSSSSSTSPSPTTASSPNAPGSSSSAAATPPSTPSPASPNSPGSAGSGSSPTPINGSTGSPAAGALPTPTTPSSSATTSSHSSTIVTVTASATSSSANSNAAWQKHASSLGTSLSVALAVVYFVFS